MGKKQIGMQLHLSNYGWITAISYRYKSLAKISGSILWESIGQVEFIIKNIVYIITVNCVTHISKMCNELMHAYICTHFWRDSCYKFASILLPSSLQVSKATVLSLVKRLGLPMFTHLTAPPHHGPFSRIPTFQNLELGLSYFYSYIFHLCLFASLFKITLQFCFIAPQLIFSFMHAVI